MKSTIKLISLILAVMILLCSCDSGIVMPQQSDTSTETESTISTDGTEDESGSETEPTSETSTKPEAEENESSSETKPEADGSESKNETGNTVENTTEPPLSEYRQSISRTRAELEEMLTITDEKFTEADSQLEAFEKIALESTDVDAVNAVYDEFEDTYYYISTQVSVASIIYYINMSDDAAYDRYNGYYEKYGDMHDKYMEKCKNIYQNSAIRDELFADWTEEEIKQLLNYSPETTDLQLENDELTDELNNLPDDDFYDRSAEIYAKIVTNNNRIAKLAGYDNYYDYATKEIYMRDYGREELEALCEDIANNYVPIFDELYDDFYIAFNNAGLMHSGSLLSYLYDPFDSMSTNYLEGYIDSLSGSMKEGMTHAFTNRNMIFSNALNSHPTAFQTYLDAFGHPFCLFGSEGQSTSTIVHELGHYYASLYNADLISYDLAEVQSQGNEMLLLDYIEGSLSSKVYDLLLKYTMYANVNTLISCVIIDEFEREVYALESVEGFTSEDFDAIMDKVCEKYGGKDFIANNLGDMYGYWRQVATNNPVYYISYAVSLTSALNIYAELKNDRETGREIYRILIEETDSSMTFLSALEKAGLPSPFSHESTENILKIFGAEK